MPAKSKAQRRFMAMAEQGGLPKSKMPKGMTKKQMHDYAATPEKGLPKRAKKKGKK